MATGEELAAMTGNWRWLALCATNASLMPFFTADVVPDDKRREMRSVCEACPVRQQCQDEAHSTRATAGFWAGRSYNRWGGN